MRPGSLMATASTSRVLGAAALVDRLDRDEAAAVDGAGDADVKARSSSVTRDATCVIDVPISQGRGTRQLVVSKVVTREPVAMFGSRGTRASTDARSGLSQVSRRTT